MLISEMEGSGAEIGDENGEGSREVEGEEEEEDFIWKYEPQSSSDEEEFVQSVGGIQMLDGSFRYYARPVSASGCVYQQQRAYVGDGYIDGYIDPSGGHVTFASPQMGHPQMGYAPQMGHPCQMGHPTQIVHPSEMGHPTQIGHPSEMGHPTQIVHPSEMVHPTQMGHPIPVMNSYHHGSSSCHQGCSSVGQFRPLNNINNNTAIVYNNHFPSFTQNGSVSMQPVSGNDGGSTATMVVPRFIQNILLGGNGEG
ncbi:uncharacterized protein [Spinacia oleracea]|uniref:Uncharacterized protein n=1 Tax=Spinacia oleracea TaxID=3562 RepID=A0ABM3RAC8_SPIOL|nr:uncharacterized protein LOC130467783 [Spinacia oleracea]